MCARFLFVVTITYNRPIHIISYRFMRASIIILVVASALISAVLAVQTTPQNPRIPNQFTCGNCSYSFFFKGQKYASPGQWWYDAVANMMRQDYLDNTGNTIEVLEAIGLTGTGHICWIFPDINPPSCATSDMFGPISIDVFSSFYPNSDATYIGSEKVDGIKCDHWQVAGQLETYDLWVQSSNVNNPIRLKETSYSGDYIVIDFHAIAFGKPDSSIFKIPSYCKIN